MELLDWNYWIGISGMELAEWNYWIGITGLELPDWNYRTTTKKIAGK